MPRRKLVNGRRSLFLGCELLTPAQGGIAVVARMTARALVDHGVEVEPLALLDERQQQVAGLMAATVRGSRVRFAVHCHRAAIGKERFVYDSVGVARAHPRFWPLNKPYAVWIHGVEVWNNLHRDRARALKRAALVLVNSHHTLKKFVDLHWPLENAHVCPLATEDDSPPARGADFTGPPTVFILARIDASQDYKGHRELIASWPEVVDAVPEARLVIAGGGSGLESVRAQAAESGVAGQIDVLGFVPDQDLPDLWRQAHVFAMPSRGEGFGLVYIEAMRHGVPVIASVQDAGQEVNLDGETGFNINLDRPEELTARLITLLENPDRARTMGQAGFRRWQQHYRYSAFAERLMSILGRFLNEA